MEGFNKQRLFIAIAAGIGVLSTFLPWAKVSFLGISDSASGLQVYGWVALLLYGGAGALAFLGEKTAAVDEKKMKLVLILGGLGALFSLIKIIQLSSESMVSTGFGCYLSFLAGLALVGIFFFVNAKGEISKTPKKVDLKDLTDIKDLTSDLTGKSETTDDTEKSETTDDTADTTKS